MKRQSLIVLLLVVSLACNVFFYFSWRQNVHTINRQANMALYEMSVSMLNLEAFLNTATNSNFGERKQLALECVKQYQSSVRTLEGLVAPLGMPTGSGLHFFVFAFGDYLDRATSSLTSVDDHEMPDVVKASQISREALAKVLEDRQYLTTKTYDRARDQIQSGLKQAGIILLQY